MIYEPKPNKLRNLLILILFILILIISAGGYLYLKAKIDFIKKEMQADLLSIADSKVAQIGAWRAERMNDALTVFSNTALIREIEQLFLLGNSSADFVKADIENWFSANRKIGNYKNIMLVNSKNKVAAALDSKKLDLCPSSQKFLSEALANKKIVFSDFYTCSGSQDINIDIIIPLMAEEGGISRTVGAAVLRMDPYKYLYPLIQSWPMPSQTAETLLVERQGDDVIFLNELRHRKNTALLLKFPVTKDTLPAARAVKGMEGVFEGLDYRNIPVISVLKKIPDSSWFVVAKIDKSEIYAPVRTEIMRVFRLAILLIAFSIIAASLLWNRKMSSFYRLAYEENKKRIQAEEELRRANADWDRTFNSLSDGVFIQDKNHVILKANKAFLDLLGLESKDVIGHKCHELVHKLGKPWPGCPAEKTILDEKSHTEEVNDPTVGKTLLVSTSPVLDDKNQITGTVHITKDISDRKKMELELKDRLDTLEKFQKVMVGRELKMKDLKDRIAELEAKIGTKEK